MAVMSKYLADEILGWQFADLPSHTHTMTFVPSTTVRAIPPPPIPAAPEIALGTPTVAALGAAALLAKNPVVSRRFWGRS